MISKTNDKKWNHICGSCVLCPFCWLLHFHVRPHPLASHIRTSAWALEVGFNTLAGTSHFRMFKLRVAYISICCMVLFIALPSEYNLMHSVFNLWYLVFNYLFFNVFVLLKVMALKSLMGQKWSLIRCLTWLCWRTIGPNVEGYWSVHNGSWLLHTVGSKNTTILNMKVSLHSVMTQKILCMSNSRSLSFSFHAFWSECLWIKTEAIDADSWTGVFVFAPWDKLWHNAVCSCRITEVSLGVHSIDGLEKDSRQVRKVKRFPHPCYDDYEKVNDLMLLKVRWFYSNRWIQKKSF